MTGDEVEVTVRMGREEAEWAAEVWFDEWQKVAHWEMHAPPTRLRGRIAEAVRAVVGEKLEPAQGGTCMARGPYLDLEHEILEVSVWGVWVKTSFGTPLRIPRSLFDQNFEVLS